MKRILCTLFLFVGVCFQLQAQEVLVPDITLRETIKERLNLPIEHHQITVVDMLELRGLFKHNSDISDLTGLEYATNLIFLDLGGNQIIDISPIAGLIHLETLRFWDNQIIDISPIAGLVNIKELWLNRNQIIDFTPLANLRKLQKLVIHDNPIPNENQFEGIEASHLKSVINAQTCELPIPAYTAPVSERINNRDFPSVFVSHVRLLHPPERTLNPIDQLALTDLSFGCCPFEPLHGLEFVRSPFGIIHMGHNLKSVTENHKAVMRINPNGVFLLSIGYVEGQQFDIPLDSPYYLRHPDGTLAKRIWHIDPNGVEGSEYLLDYTHPDVIELIVQYAVAIAKCGLYDGIQLDRWDEGGDFHDENAGLITPEAELNARIQILSKIREAVHDDFLIVVNTTWQKIPHSAPYVNGAFIETWAHYQEEYTRQDFIDFEAALRWYEENLREPSFTLLRGEANQYTGADDLINQRNMRVFTTLSLTHSDGYVTMSTTPPAKTTYWYDFWDADLGQPIGEKAQLYRNRDGIFIREFTNGWAVYNRSGKEHQIQLVENTTGVSSGIKGHAHTLSDLDGEMFLKTEITTDLNGDGVINVLDLVIITNAFGETAPDLNGDGIVNILDLVIVANAFGD